MSDQNSVSDTKKRLGIFCFYDHAGHADGYIEVLLKALRPYLNDLVIVANGKLDGESRAMFGQFTDQITVRENKGLDAAAYQQAMLALGWDKLESYDEVICFNDTVMGPLYPFSELFDAMEAKNVDFWGITAHPKAKFGEESIPAHIQAYWHVYGKRLVSSGAFQQYWESMPVMTDYAEVTRKHEMRFTPYFEQLGFTWVTYIDAEKYAGLSPYPLLFMPKQIIENDRCPIFKRRSFFVDYGAYFDKTAGQPGSELYDYIREHTDYDVNLIWDTLLRSFNLDDIRQAMHLDYVLPTKALNPREGEAPSSAFIQHVYFMDLLDDTFHYLNSLPESTDLYITSTKDKIPQIRAYADSHGFTHPIEFLPVKNRGRDVSALFVAASGVVLSGKYEVIGFAHDKKSSQVGESGHDGTESQGFAYKLMENTLGSKDYVQNVLTLFVQNPRLGLAAPTPPWHAIYFAHTIPNDWGPNFDGTQKLMHDMLGLDVPMTEAKRTMSAIGSCYWFRVEALKPLFEYGWDYEDFLPEGKMGVDGSISHAIERATGYVAQSQGYYAAWILTDKYAAIELDSLLHASKIFMGTLGPYRWGDSLIENSRSSDAKLTALRVFHERSLRNRIHNRLRGIAHKVILPLPKPLRDAAYNLAWGPVAILRKLRSHK
ncbi:rhamnan synthesis F family protein [Bifidobacterium catulorum]|uniref:Lipopolysaccharide biosynthesis protein n=1 Tax=Bifidobacterium catulorum TaxID=1630173 RepID=A0A2U2MRF6_9BIFI|nr:rhamnan synthesis F family protein [Bifidobacterium catulorum]PWG59422.1 lipopolysaccharide biosynthesis protein [Bifidobacterium catulorum]